ncbi:MAG: flavodoxin [Lachnospiraceae bacterium]|nr:flavodoxin [Lachnospiraceae bacterium]MDD3617096.1 flavodoxin [Lachnospiraceae bacterium]
MGKWIMMQKRQIKIVLDVIMSIALLFLMAFQVTGDKYHEWIGAGMLVLFVIHNLLNAGWYKALFKGKYSVHRVLRTIVNLLVLAAIILTGYSGIVMSRFVFDFLPIDGGMATARKLHLAGSYWAFVLMSVHLGMHWNMMIGKLGVKRTTEQTENKILIWVLRIAAAVIVVYGAVLFGQSEIFRNMFFQNEFAILDYETPGALIILQNLAMMSAWIFVGHYLSKGIAKISASGKTKKAESLYAAICIIAAAVVILCSIVMTPQRQETGSWGGTDAGENTMADSQTTQETAQTEEPDTEDTDTEGTANDTASEAVSASDEFVYITGGTYDMGSPESESWRTPDETQHTVTVSDFYMSAYELTQEEYEAVMGNNPSTFSGDNLPLENISWLEAVVYCNTRSEQEGLTPVYLIDGDIASGSVNISWNRGADGYRLPTEAEWEYACRAGTVTPFNTETSISPEESNYYGHYPYDIEENYFEQDNLSTQPGEYRETTVAVDSFAPNAWGLYNMHGNVSEWVWDYYGSYDTAAVTNPTGPVDGNLKVYRGGGWNDFAKNMRSAYRATLEEDMGSFNIGIRLVRNASAGSEDIIGTAADEQGIAGQDGAGNVLIAYFSWGGNTQGVAQEIQSQTGADLFEITLTEPYSSDYNTVLDQAQHDQNIQARPEIADHVENMDDYDTVLIGYPNWWASIPMPIASFLEEYDFSGKTIIPFCSHGGGRFGQSLTAIAKLAPDSYMGEGLSIHYSGGSSLSNDVEEWLRSNGII